MSTPQDKPKLVDVTLAKPHTHEGKQYPVGAKIKVTEPEREWLAGVGTVTDNSATTQKPKTTPPEASDK